MTTPAARMAEIRERLAGPQLSSNECIKLFEHDIPWLLARVGRLEKALEWIANHDTFGERDQPVIVQCARATLSQPPEEE